MEFTLNFHGFRMDSSTLRSQSIAIHFCGNYLITILFRLLLLEWEDFVKFPSLV